MKRRSFLKTSNRVLATTATPSGSTTSKDGIHKWELTDLINQSTVVKLISTGDESRKAFDPIQLPIEGLDYILDDPAIVKGEEVYNCALLQYMDMLLIATSGGYANEVELAIKIQEFSREQGIFTIVLVQVPMTHGVSEHKVVIERNLSLLRQKVDTLLIVTKEYDQYMLISQKDATSIQGLALAAKGITEIATTAGLVCTDIADVRAVLLEMGVSLMGIGSSVGENRAREAATKALACLSNQDVHLSDAEGVLVNIRVGMDLDVEEYMEVDRAIKRNCSEAAAIALGSTLDPDMEGLHVTVIATGLDQ